LVDSPVPLSLLFEELNDLLSTLFNRFDEERRVLQTKNIHVDDVITMHTITAMTINRRAYLSKKL